MSEQLSLPSGNRPQLDFPPEILEPLQEARIVWSRHGYQICARAMVEIDAALDDLLAYQAAVRDFEATFGSEQLGIDHVSN